jgi:choice-of-anchor A domain-containing protein
MNLRRVFISMSLFLSSSAMAQLPSATCPKLGLYDYAVVTAEGAEGLQRSDFQGPVAVGGPLVATMFQFEAIKPGCLAISGSGEFIELANVNVLGAIEGAKQVTVHEGNVEGSISAQEGVRLSHVGLIGPITSPEIQISNVDNNIKQVRARPLVVPEISGLVFQMKQQSEELATMKSNITPQKKASLRLALGNQTIGVAHLNSQDLTVQGRIEIVGDSDQILIVNVFGKSVRLDHIEIILRSKRSGGAPITSPNIIWNFPQAENLFIWLDTPDEPNPGWTGSILAPKAVTEAYNSRLTGGLYVHSLRHLDPAKATIQINRPRFAN